MSYLPLSEAPEQCVFVQISDLHIGGRMENHQHRRIPHQKGHNIELCEGLQYALLTLREDLGWPEDRALPVVVSGDLTQLGQQADLKLAHRFLFEETPLRFGTWGLNLDRDAVETVPGNHDHWDGTTQALPNKTHNADLFPSWFRRHPWAADQPMTSPDGNLRVELFGVDSTSGYRGAWLPKHRQRGSLHEDEVRALREHLGRARAAAPQDATTLRVVVCHHSLQGASSWKPSRMELDSERSLLAAAGDHEVFAVLSGHTHTFLVPPARHERGTYELRSSSTLQGKRPTPGHGFYVHQIVWHEDGDLALTWYPHRCIWSGSGFLPVELDAEEDTLRLPRRGAGS